MTTRTFILINKTVTAEQAALVAAGINPAEVNDSVSEAKKGNHYGWEIAVTVRNALLKALLPKSMQLEWN
ncbi:MAG: hypothetical protein ACRDCY_02680 [Aeromonas veronii]